MKQQINEIKRMQQLAGLITESQLDEFGGYGFKEGSDEDIDFVVVNRNTPAFKQAFSPLERLDMDSLNDDELRLHIKATIDKDDLEDARAYMEQLMQKSITPGGRHAARIAAMGTKSDGGPTGIKGTEY
jgi:hypothetical protein